MDNDDDDAYVCNTPDYLSCHLKKSVQITMQTQTVSQEMAWKLLVTSHQHSSRPVASLNKLAKNTIITAWHKSELAGP